LTSARASSSGSRVDLVTIHTKWHGFGGKGKACAAKVMKRSAAFQLT